MPIYHQSRTACFTKGQIPADKPRPRSAIPSPRIPFSNVDYTLFCLQPTSVTGIYRPSLRDFWICIHIRLFFVPG